MARNKMSDLRDHLFAAIEGLADEEKPLEINRAKAIADVAQVIVNSVKVEIDYQKLVYKEEGVAPENNISKFINN